MVSARLPRNPFVERDEEHERLWRKQRLALAFRIFGRFGFDEGVAGHITARDPGDPDLFWVNPFGMSFKQITVDDLILVDHQGTVVDGTWPVNRAAFAIHSSIHAARPDAVAAAHSHSKFGRAYATLGRLLDPLTQDSCLFFEDHALFDDYTGTVNDPEEGKRLAHALGGNKAVILRNHGLLTAADIVLLDRRSATRTTRKKPGKQAFPMLGAAGKIATLDWNLVHPEPKLSAYELRVGLLADAEAPQRTVHPHTFHLRDPASAVGHAGNEGELQATHHRSLVIPDIKRVVGIARDRIERSVVSCHVTGEILASACDLIIGQHLDDPADILAARFT